MRKWDDFVAFFNTIQRRLFKASYEKGHHDHDLYDVATLEAFRLLGLMHTEISEAMQIVKRNGITNLSGTKYDRLAEELADVVIRIMDFAELHQLNVAQAIREKAIYNETRPHQFGSPRSGETYADES